MATVILNRDTVIRQTVQNMVEAGVISMDEADMFTDQLDSLDQKELLTVLIVSHNLKDASVKTINYYPIDMELISNN